MKSLREITLRDKPSYNMNSQLSAPLLIKTLVNKARHFFQKFGFCTIRLWKFSYLEREENTTKTEPRLRISNNPHTSRVNQTQTKACAILGQEAALRGLQ